MSNSFRRAAKTIAPRQKDEESKVRTIDELIAECKTNSSERMMETAERNGITRNHERHLGYIYVTYEEAKAFTQNPRARNTDYGHVNKLKKQWLDHYATMPAIIINVVTQHIIDGQHRLEAFRKLVESGEFPKDILLKVELVEILDEEDELAAIIDANTNSRTWQTDDYVQCYVKASIESYVLLEKWCKSHILVYKETKKGRTCKYTYGAAIIKGKKYRKELKIGAFEVTQEELEKANIIHDELLWFVDFFGLREGQASMTWIEAMATEWWEARELLPSFKDWQTYTEKERKALKDMPKAKSDDWDNIFSRIYKAYGKAKKAA